MELAHYAEGYGDSKADHEEQGKARCCIRLPVFGDPPRRRNGIDYMFVGGMGNLQCGLAWVGDFCGGVIDSARVSGASYDIIVPWFRKLELPEIIDIKPENRYSIDEAGIMEGQGLNDLVVGSSQCRNIQKKQPGSRVWISFIECISATGQVFTLLVIFKGKHIQQQWFPIDFALYKDWNFIVTDNGWTTDATGLEWLEKVFIPQTTLSEAGDARLLILDSYGSRASAIIWKTPQKASDLRLYASTMIQEKEPDLPTRHLLFHKIIKAFDIKDYNLMESGKRIKQLEYQLDTVIPKKRRKVVTSPYTRFSGIRAIREAQIVAGDRGINAEDSDDTIESGGTGDFIEVG
ncbi:transposase [Sclerotinia borealis F-4128]|uniref:Transposase n=1 Tax=Sclerotinia borealis (strain F-4128) TaxID=1432307 RepID=W9C5Q6_SCLBF|nr:transposase [Sclerotinia borealis F-4128]